MPSGLARSGQMLSIPARHASCDWRVLFDPIYEHMILKQMAYIIQSGLSRPSQMLFIPATHFASGWLSVASVLQSCDPISNRVCHSEVQAKMQISISIWPWMLVFRTHLAIILAQFWSCLATPGVQAEMCKSKQASGLELYSFPHIWQLLLLQFLIVFGIPRSASKHAKQH